MCRHASSIALLSVSGRRKLSESYAQLTPTNTDSSPVLFNVLQRCTRCAQKLTCRASWSRGRRWKRSSLPLLRESSQPTDAVKLRVPLLRITALTRSKILLLLLSTPHNCCPHMSNKTVYSVILCSMTCCRVQQSKRTPCNGPNSLRNTLQYISQCNFQLFILMRQCGNDEHKMGVRQTQRSD